MAQGGCSGRRGLDHSDRGTGQGSVISPLLANVYLHYVFDLWAERWRHREAVGNVIIVRYADDLIIGFELDKDARRFQEAMFDRLREFSLSLHPEKTRLIEFGRFAVERRTHRRLGKPETFNFLGFTFICGTSSGRMTFSPGPASFIRGPKSASPSITRGGSRVPEWGSLGSVRGALSNERPYRDLRNVVAKYPFERSHRFAGIQPKLA